MGIKKIDYKNGYLLNEPSKSHCRRLTYKTVGSASKVVHIHLPFWGLKGSFGTYIYYFSEVFSHKLQKDICFRIGTCTSSKGKNSSSHTENRAKQDLGTSCFFFFCDKKRSVHVHHNLSNENSCFEIRFIRDACTCNT